MGIVISKDLKEDLISVSYNKRSDRVMSIKLGVEETVVNITGDIDEEMPADDGKYV